MDSFPSFMPYKNWRAKLREALNYGSFETASLSLTPKSQISLASCLWPLRLDTLSGRVNCVAYYSSVPLAVEAYKLLTLYLIKKRSDLDELRYRLWISLIQLFGVELYSGLDGKQVDDAFHKFYSVLFFIDVIWDVWLWIILLCKPIQNVGD